ncbi:MAG: ribosome assembly factor SBDS [Candidatus Pacearchaeota archaeon]
MEKTFLSDSKKNLVVARIKSHGKHFEILVFLDKALELKKTGKGNILNILESPGIFSDIKKGIKVKNEELEEVFGTTDIYKIAEKIIKEGELQLPLSYKESVREIKYKQIIDWLSSSCSDPKGIPYPPERIKNAIEQVGAKIDESKPAEEQAIAILKLIQKIMPIKLATKRLTIKIPSIYTGKLYGYLKDFILSEEWLSDGSLSCTVEIPTKLQSEFYDKLNSITHGAAITKEI